MKRVDEAGAALMREWIRAEIEYAIAHQEVGADDHRVSAQRALREADRLFELVKATLP
jgi:hypothetical protein